MPVQVTAIKKEGKRPWEISVSGGKLYKTFDPDVVSGLTVGMWIEPVTEISDNKYHDIMLNEWKATDPPAGSSPLAPIVLERDAVPSEVWESKDRRIAMESAYGSATKFYAGRDVPPPEVASLARRIFRDILAAGAGETFEPKETKKATPPRPTSEELPY